MLSKLTLLFLQQLKENNHKEWMDANRQAYLDARGNFETFGHHLLEKMIQMDPLLGGLTVKECTFRINRDVRFSANKAPYKTNMAMFMAMGGKKSTAAGYYCHIEPGSSFVAGGVWMPMPPALKRIRQEIDYNFDVFKKIVESKNFAATFGGLDRSEGGVLNRPPKGYEADNPAVEYLKLKSFIATTRLKDSLLTQATLIDQIVDTFRVMKPFVAFLNEAQHTEE